MDSEQNTARPLAPEDIRPGDYVAVLHTIQEIWRWWCDEAAWRKPEILRAELLPTDAEPMQVIEVCLPYVLVRRAGGTFSTLDCRRCRLARVAKRFGRKAFKRLKSAQISSPPNAD